MGKLLVVRIPPTLRDLKSQTTKDTSKPIKIRYYTIVTGTLFLLYDFYPRVLYTTESV